jgi:1,4-alpha-glucan branching enzyme
MNESVTSPARRPVDFAVLDSLVRGDFAEPHSVLGPHVHDGAVTVRVLRPMAERVEVLVGDSAYPLEHEYEGVFAGVLPFPTVPDYRLAVTYAGNRIHADDAYRFLPTVGEIDQYLVGEGRHEQLWHILGAHPRTYRTYSGPVHGTSFAVWAPNARGVRVVGDFNYWNGVGHPMRAVGATGIWELFAPEVGEGTRYKYEILGRDGIWRSKADPVAFRTESPPATASVVFASHHEWQDGEWMRRRAEVQPVARPMSIYEVHLGSWRWGRSYRQLADELVDYVRDMGFSHIEFLPLAEHPFGGSWGYQVSSYFAPTARFGSPDDLRFLIDRCHQAGIGVIVDWVPAHFPRDDWALARFDGTPLYEHPDPRRGEAPDWGTLVFDFGRREVRNFLVANAIFWFEEFHIDGLRVDAVASMLYLDYSRREGQWAPNQYGGRENLDAITFLQEMNARGVHRVGRGHQPHQLRRSGLRLQVEHGLDARLAQLHEPPAHLPAVPPQPDDLRHDVRLQRELRAAAVARRGGARQGLASRPHARGSLAAARQPARLPGLHVGAPGQAAPLHGRRAGAGG